ncbi:hypothetical protein TcBrA4_0112400 [Trypanosoma cruzi]|nr:hypothetical protein TcBrA4_0112400 [Trypanosoma cruzi]
MRLTPAERIAGLSKRKVRRFIQAADLRVRDLGLSERIVFDDEDEEEKKRRTRIQKAPRCPPRSGGGVEE